MWVSDKHKYLSVISVGARNKNKMDYALYIIGLPKPALRKFFSPAVSAWRHVCDHFIPHARNNYHPHVFGHRVTALFSICLVSVKIFTVALLSFGPVLPAYSSAINISNIISLTNESRSQFSLSALSENASLDKAAQAKADDMLKKGYFSHNTPDGKTPWDFIQNSGYNYLMAGENLAVNFTESEAVEQAWMNSPGHKANILNKNFEEIGVGISQGEFQGHTAVFVVQMFGTPVEQKISLLSKPTVVQKQAVPAPVPATVKSDSAKQQAGKAASLSSSVNIEGDKAVITAQAPKDTVKALAYFGQQAVMLTPKGDNLWQGEISLDRLAKTSTTVKVVAFDMNNKTETLQLANFSGNIADNYNVLGAAVSAKVNWLGQVFDPKLLEQKVYLLFIAAMLTCLILAIAIKRHVQHLSIVANGSFVAILAVLLMVI